MKTEGLGGFYVGYYATLVRDVPYTMLELGLYENVKNYLKKLRKGKSLTMKDEIFAAAFAGGISAFVTTPFDVVKTRIMLQVRTR